ADASSGQPADLGGGGEARGKDQRVEVAAAERHAGADQAAFLRAPADRGTVQATAVVADLQHHFGAFAADRDADGAFLLLARAAALLRRLDAVRDRVAQHVLQRRG